jgi:hypothetical protein
MKAKDLRPYQLVHVRRPMPGCQGESYRYIGETMSLPIPRTETNELTIMVRRVPGHPGTLDEINVDWIEGVAKKQDARRVSYAVVKGVGAFPLDMLRYDNAVPVNFTLDDTFTGPQAKLLPGMGEELIVAKVGGSLTTTVWTKERWSSFLWGIREIAVESLNNSR